MEKVFYMFVLMTLCATVRVYSLECYVCTDCGTVSANDLQSCDAPATTTSAPTNVTTIAPTNATTSAPTNATTSAPTNGNDTTNAQTNSTTGSSTNSNDTTSAQTNANDTTSAQTNTTTGASTNANDTTNAQTNTTSNATINAPAPEESSQSRKKRSAEDGTHSNRGCICENGKCECSGNRFFRAADVVTRAVTYQCYKHVKTVDGKEVVDRGCQSIPDGSNSTACAILNVTDCTACQVDKCNSALSLQISVAFVVSAFCVSFI